MTVVMLIFTIALFFGLVGTPVARRTAVRLGFIAVPKADRAHTEPTALMGGVAIYLAAIGGWLIILFTAYFIGNPFRLAEFASIVMSASFMAIIGLWDDRWALRPSTKLGLQFIPVISVFLTGTRVRLPLASDPLLFDLVNFALTAGWILLVTNAVNYLDNADGIAAMTSSTASAIFLLIAVLNGQQLVSVLAAAVLGASLSFARYNLPLPRSTIFMGDSGSLFLGFLLAILGIKIRIPTNTLEVTWIIPIIVLGVPIFDTVMVFISRTRRGVSFFTGGVDHTTHRLARLGLNGLSVALTISLVSGALGLVAIFITRASRVEAYTIAASLLLLALYVLWQIEFKRSFQFRTGKEPPQAQPSKV